MGKLFAYADDEGRLVFPPELAFRFGLKPGAKFYIDEKSNALCLRQPVTHLAKVYIEPTNRCNLECRICMRNVWDEPLGEMSRATFARIIEALRSFSPPPAVFFGGLGEPLAHPDIVEMVAQAKSLGSFVELITNGTLLTKERAHQLIEAGLDRLWVSLDGATPESFADVRLGAALPEVLTNLANFRRARWPKYPPFLFFDYNMKPEIGIVFVAMKRNIADLPSVLRLGYQFGAMYFMVTNVLPYAREMCKEVIYSQVIWNISHNSFGPHLELPNIDVSEITAKSLYHAMRSYYDVNIAGCRLSESSNRCPFIEKGATAIGWDGGLSPCLSLLHSHVSFLEESERFLRRYIVGNVSEADLMELWHQPEYAAFRERVQTFEFSPCTTCGGCDLVETNEKDCFGNTFPTCGGCLWAQGVIQCP